MNKQPNSQKIVMALARILDAYEQKDPLVSCQGQAMDGYNALAHFVDIAKQARSLRDGEDSSENPDN